jgi:coatomer protein complex subunit alpha (xenin)
VQDAKVKFGLALECGNIAVALECAAELDSDACWHQLGVEALRQGNHQVVEAAYQKTKNFERLSFLYLITGNTEKLSKKMHIATLRNDTMGRFHNSLYLGDVPARVGVLRASGQPRLAYVAAVLHGLVEEAAEIADEICGEADPETGERDESTLPVVTPEMHANAKLLLPPVPVLRESNWPLLDVGKGFFDRLDEAEIEEEEADVVVEQNNGGGGGGGGDEDILGWGDDDDLGFGAMGVGDAAAGGDDDVLADEGGDAGGWGDDGGLGDLDGLDDILAADGDALLDGGDGAGGGGDYFLMSASGKVGGATALL